MMALEPFSRPLLFPVLVNHYSRQRTRLAPSHYVDKSHPVLWFAEALATVFPTALFVGVQRNPYDTVASMIAHQGVLEWQRHWRKFSVPNEFLGISHHIAETYDEMSTAQKCAIRWVAQTKRLADLSSVLGERMCVIHYEDLVLDPPRQIARVSQCLGFPLPLKLPRIHSDSVEQWRRQLTDAMYQEIKEIVCATTTSEHESTLMSV